MLNHLVVVTNEGGDSLNDAHFTRRFAIHLRTDFLTGALRERLSSEQTHGEKISIGQLHTAKAPVTLCIRLFISKKYPLARRHHNVQGRSKWHKY